MKPANDFVTINLLYEDNMGQGLQRVALVLNVDLERNAYALQILIDFSVMIHFISNHKTFRREFNLIPNLITHIYLSAPEIRCHCL